jgi:hypothetical protein
MVKLANTMLKGKTFEDMKLLNMFWRCIHKDKDKRGAAPFIPSSFSSDSE